MSSLSEANILLVCELFPHHQVDAIFSTARNHSSVASLIKQLMDHPDQLNVKVVPNYSLVAPSKSSQTAPASTFKCSTSSSFELMNQLSEIRRMQHERWKVRGGNPSNQSCSQKSSSSSSGTWSGLARIRNLFTMDTDDDIGKLVPSFLYILSVGPVSQRHSRQLHPLIWNQQLAELGKAHSKDMGESQVPFGHSGFQDRVSNFAFETCDDLCATNHQMNQGMPPAATAVKGWIESPGHRKNLESHHSHCGIGVYQTADGLYFLTQLFGLW